VGVVCSRNVERKRSDGGLWLRKGKMKKGKGDLAIGEKMHRGRRVYRRRGEEEKKSK
jgi:hypothetical protein